MDLVRLSNAVVLNREVLDGAHLKLFDALHVVRRRAPSVVPREEGAAQMSGLEEAAQRSTASCSIPARAPALKEIAR